MSRSIPLGILAAAAQAGYSWSANDQLESLVYVGGAYANLTNAQYFLFGMSDTGTTTTTYSRATNPSLGWTAGTMPASGRWGKSATNGTRLVSTRWDAATAGAFTTNGTTWTTTTIWATALASTDILWDGTRFLVTSTDSSANLSHSTDGSTWTRIDIGNGFSALGYDGSSRYIALNNASSSTARSTTSNPTTAGNWADITLPSAQTWRSIAFGNGIWLAVNNQDVTATSSNGTTWTTAATLPQNLDTAATGAARVIFADGKFWFIRGSGLASSPVTIYSSSTGSSWETVATIPANSGQGDFRHGAAWGVGPNNIFVAGYDNLTDGAGAVFVGVKQ
jgi:hypothetical protein